MTADDRLDDLLLRWEELHELGKAVSAEELCRDCPELADELRRRIDVLRKLNPALDLKAGATSVGAGEPGATVADERIARTAGIRPGAVPGYDLLAELGRGGMGVVYKAKQKNLDRVVALKMILAGGHASATQRARFQSEAEAAARLQHPNIVPVYETGEHDGCPFFSLEFVDGHSLVEYLFQGLPKPEKAAALAEQLARAVAYAHENGIVHRDLKPGNILLTRDGSPKITDFGLAKRLDDDQSRTATGDVLGTPSYMSPEQAAGKTKEVGPATDVYALGAILYEMLTGRPPFEGRNSWDTVSLVLSAEPAPPTRSHPRVPRDLETICLKCLQKEPAKRYPSALALAEDLHRFQIGEPITARPISLLERGMKWVRRRPAVAALLAVSAVLLLSLLIGGWVTAGRMAATNYALHDVNKSSHRALIRLNVKNGSHHVEDEDLVGSLVWYARALTLEDEEARKEAHRIRLAAVLRGCPRLRQLYSHDEAINRVAFSPDGKWMVTASDDNTARVWDTATGKLRFDPLRHDGWVVLASFNHDGSRLLTASDNTAQVWDARSGDQIATLTGHKGPLQDARFRPDGEQIVTASSDKTARLWNTEDGSPIGGELIHDGEVVNAVFSHDGKRILTASSDGSARIWRLDGKAPSVVHRFKHDGAVTNAVFSPDGKKVATGCADRIARLWDADSGQAIGDPMRHQGEVLRIAFRGDGQQLATASADFTARLWDGATGQSLTPALRHYSRVTSIAFSPDGARLLTASDDNSARVWDTANGRAASPPLPHNGDVADACFSPDGRRIATVSQDTTARIYELNAAPAVAPTLKQSGTVRCVAYSPDGTRLLTASSDHKAYVWDARSGKQLSALEGHTDVIQCASFSRDGARILTASADGTARVWNAADFRLVARMTGHTGPILRATFRADGTQIVTASDDGTARVWDATTGVQRLRVESDKNATRREMLDAVFSPDGQYVATGSADCTGRIWDAVSGEPVGPALRHHRRVVRVAFSPSGGHLATASWDRTVQIWEVATGRPALSSLLQHAGTIRDMAYSPDGSTLVTCSDDNTARLWDAATGTSKLSPLRHFGSMLTARFSADGKRVATASSDGSGRVWDATTGEPLTPPLYHDSGEQVTDIAFNPAGDRLATASSDGAVEIWPLIASDRSAQDLEHWAELLSGTRITTDGGGLIPLEAPSLRKLWEELKGR